MDPQERIEQLEKQLQEKEEELQEFQLDSKDYEAELERELKRCEEELKNSNVRQEQLQIEIQQMKEKAKEQMRDMHSQLERLHDELTFSREQEQLQRDKIRELEVLNDEHEMKVRSLESTMNDLEGRYNKQMEKQAMMEHELELSNENVMEAQRLKDELRDALHEISILQARLENSRGLEGQKEPNGQGEEDMETDTPPLDEPVEMKVVQMEDKAVLTSPGMKSRTQPTTETRSMATAQLLEDVMQRMHSLEDRLKHCRSLAQPLVSKPAPSR